MIKSALKKAQNKVFAPFQNRAVILLYHRVMKVERDPFSICISPEVFEEQVQYLNQSYEILQLSELVHILSQGLKPPKRAIVLTFDDGYGDNFLNAKPLLQKYKIPATFFIATQSTHCGEFWWDELERLFAPDPLQMDHFFSVWDDLRMKSQTERSAVLEEFRTGKTDLLPRSDYRLLSDREIFEIARDNLFEIGAHTESHSRLSALGPHLQKAEIENSKLSLEAITSRPVRFFSYPFGGKGDYSSETVKLIHDLKFSAACAAFPSFVHSGSDLFQLPRFHVNPISANDLGNSLSKLFQEG